MSLARRVAATLPAGIRSTLRDSWYRATSDSLSAARHKVRAYTALRHGRPLCLNLGCGDAPLDGWLNVDQVRVPQGIAWDLRRGLPMLDDAAIDFIYHEHFFEHVDCRAGRRLLLECARVLKPGGTMRIAMPDLDDIVAGYLAGWADQENEFFAEKRHLYGDQLLGTPGEGLDLAFRGWSHRFLYGERDLIKMLALNGFGQTRRVSHGQSEVPDLRGLETRSPEQSSLIVETRKTSEVVSQ